MNVPELLQQLDLGQMIEVFSISTLNIGGTDVFNFHAGTNEVYQPIVWQGVTYQPFPIKSEGFEMTTRGALPRPRVTVANVTGAVTALMRVYEDLIGAQVARKRTFARYLDGQPTADPGQHLPDDIYYIERKVSENKHDVVFELASALDLEGVQLPGRDIVANVCPWEYRKAECGYTGNAYFDVFDNAVSTLSEDVCSKSVTGCKRRFGVRGVLPFGGFPAARTYKY